MLKIIARIVIILLVAGALGGGLYALVNSTAGQSALASVAGGQYQFGGGSNAGLAAQGFQPGLRQGGGFGDHEGAGGGLTTVVKNLGIMALITAGVVGIQKVIRLAFRKRLVPAS